MVAPSNTFVRRNGRSGVPARAQNVAAVCSVRSASGAGNPSPHILTMSKLLRGVAAGYGAKKLGGGCFSTVLIFIILWWVLGHFGIFK